MSTAPTVPDAGPQRQWVSHWPNALWVILLIAALIPVWMVRYFPTQDGPAHVYNASILRDYLLPGGAPLREYFEIVLRPLPNLLGHLILALFTVVLPGMMAEKLLASVCIISVPLAMLYALRGINREAGALAFLAFPLAFNRLLAMGFYNFSLGLALMLVLVGYWVRHRDDLTPRRAVVLGGLALLTHLAHLSAVVPGLLTIGILAVVRWPQGRSAIAAGVALLPTIVLAVWYTLRGPDLGEGEIVVTVGQHLLDLARFNVLVSYSPQVEYLGAGFGHIVSLLLLYAVVRKIAQRRWERSDVLLGLAGVLLVLYINGRRDAAFNYFLPGRLSLLIAVVLILWLGTQPLGRGLRVATPLLAGAVMVGMMLLNLPHMARASRDLGEFCSTASTLQRGSTLIALVYHPYGGTVDEPIGARVAAFLHGSGHVAAERGCIDLWNYEAMAKLFPVRFRDALNPRGPMRFEEPTALAPPFADIEAWQSKTGRRVDYVLVWDLRAEDLTAPQTRKLLETLARGYRPVRNSGRVQVYESVARRGPTR